MFAHIKNEQYTLTCEASCFAKSKLFDPNITTKCYIVDKIHLNIIAIQKQGYKIIVC